MIAVSGILPWLEDRINKVEEVNNCLKLMRQQRTMLFISYCETIDPNLHLNRLNFHFNSCGIRAFAESF